MKHQELDHRLTSVIAEVRLALEQNQHNSDRLKRALDRLLEIRKKNDEESEER